MDPVLIAIAAAAAGKTTEAVVDGVRQAARLVRKRFAQEPENAAVLLAAQDDESELDTLAEVIDRACGADPDFLRQLSDTVGRPIQITQVRNETHGDVMFQNNFNGGAPQNVVQANEINGLNLN